MKNTEARDYKCSEPSTQSSFGTLVLQILDGNHAGAIHPLDSREILLVGSSSDCDLILSDATVAPHHCLISRFGQELRLRAMEVAVGLGDEELEPGKTQALVLEQPISLGEAVICLGLRFDDLADVPSSGLPALESTASESNLKATGWSKPAFFVTLFIVGALLMGTGYRGFTQQLTTESPLESNSDHFAPSELVKVVGSEPPFVLNGSSDKTGNRIADDVREILRLLGIHAQTSYLGEGRVEVKGFLGDEQALGAVIQSRAMRDIQGLDKIVAINLDARPEAKSQSSAQRVVSIVNGDDPYLITTDGSRYYSGALLPNGSRLLAIEDQYMILETDRGPDRVSGADTLLTN